MLLSEKKEGSRILTKENLEKFREDVRKGFKLKGGGRNIRELKL